MNKKTTFILFVLFIVLVIIFFLKESVEFNGGRRPFKNTEIKTVIINNAADKSKVRLNHRETGWFLSDGWPAKSNIAGNMIRGLEQLKLKDVISTNPSRFGDFKVTPEEGISVTLFSRREEPVTFYLGKNSFSRTNTRTNTRANIYFRIKGSSKVYLTGGISRYIYVKPEESFWKDPYVLREDFSKIDKIQVEIKKDLYEIKRSTGRFKNLTETLSAAPITGVEKDRDILNTVPYAVIRYVYSDSSDSPDGSEKPDKENKVFKIFLSEEGYLSENKYLINIDGIKELYNIDSAAIENVKAAAFDNDN